MSEQRIVEVVAGIAASSREPLYAFAAAIAAWGAARAARAAAEAAAQAAAWAAAQAPPSRSMGGPV